MKKQSECQKDTRDLIRNGALIPQKKCEICGKYEGTKQYSFETPVKIFPHHYRGYDFPFDVWWVCRSCNRNLINKHDNSLTIETARAYIFGDGYKIEKLYTEAYKNEIIKKIESTKNKLLSLEIILTQIDENIILEGSGEKTA
jgi:hypothetical protein